MNRLLNLSMMLCLVWAPVYGEEEPEGNKKPERETRTQMVLPIQKLTDKNAATVIEKLKAWKSIAEAEARIADSEVDVIFASGATCSLIELQKVLKTAGVQLAIDRWLLPMRFSIVVKGEFREWQFDPTKYKNHGRAHWQNVDSQKLLRELMALEGIKIATYDSGTVIKVGGDRTAPFNEVMRLVGEYGDKSRGSAEIADIRWSGEEEVVRANPEGKRRR